MTAFKTAEQLKDAIKENSSIEFFDKFILQRETPHFSNEKMQFVSEVLSSEYQISVPKDELVIVGSSKIGFALHKKCKKGEVVAQPFRPYGPNSDIDLSICSPSLFSLLWHELSAFACKQALMPFRHKKLGDYLTYGWLRPDQFPVTPAPSLLRCDNLAVARNRIRRDRRRGHPKIEFGVFYDVDHLRLYQLRSIELCRRNLENPL